MPRDSSGNYTLPAGNPVVTGTTIASSWGNTTLNDIGSVLTNSLDRNGNGHMLAPLTVPNGVVGAPSLAFNSDTTTGFYLISAGRIGLAVGGVLVLDMQTNIWSLKAGNLTMTAPPSGNTLTVNAVAGGSGIVVNGAAGAPSILINGIGNAIAAADLSVSVANNATAFSQVFNSSTGTAAVQVWAVGNSTHGFDFGITSTNYSGAYLTGGPTGESAFITTGSGSTMPISIGTHNTERVRIADNGAVTVNGNLGVNGAAPPAQVTGWGTPTGPAVQLNYSGSAATLAQTSAAVAKIITDLKALGLYAA
jgi:hypothetical protein